MDLTDEYIEDAYPLSPLQQGMLFHSLRGHGPDLYCQQSAFVAEGLDVDCFRRAWQSVLDRHTILRTSFHFLGLDQPVQRVHRHVAVPLEIHDWRSVSPAEQEARLKTFLRKERERGIDLTVAPLMRLAVIKLDETTSYYAWSHHHILLDGWSAPLINEEVFSCYKALIRGEPWTPAAPLPYRHYVDWLNAQDLGEAQAFWRRTLKDFTSPTPLPLDRTAGSSPKRREGPAEQLLRLPAELTDELRLFGRRHGLTLNTLVLGAWALLLSRHGGGEDVLFGATVSGRPGNLPGVEGMIGLFINTLPVRVRVPAEEELVGWLKRLQEQQAERMQFEFSPLAAVHGWSDVPRGTPLFHSLVVFENYPVGQPAAARPAGLKVRRIHQAVEHTNYPLMLVAVPKANELLLRIVYASARFDRGAIQQMLLHVQTLLESMVSSPKQKVQAISPMSAREHFQVVSDWNDTSINYPQRGCLHELIQDQVERTPDAIAVECSGQRLTYRELNDRANQLAHHLMRLGVGPEVPVAVCLERSLEMVVGLLAVLKSGGAYVPLDPTYPRERLEFMLAEVRAPVVITQEHLATGALAELIEAQGTILDVVSRPPPRAMPWAIQLRPVGAPDTGPLPLSPEGAALDSPGHRPGRDAGTPTCSLRPGQVSNAIDSDRTDNPVSGVRPEHPAYIIYTSGSTGNPKGAVNTHAGIVNRLLWMQDTYRLDESDRVLQKTPYSFDVSVWEFFWPLLTGARLVVARPGGHQDPDYLARLIEQEGITTTHFVPSMLSAFLEVDLAGCSYLRRVICSGEALTWDLQERFFSRLDAELHNLYGPTEASVDVTFWACQKHSPRKLVPIGRPIANMKMLILDERLQPVPIGVAGELHIGGIGLARGYWNRPDLTAEKFVPDPFSAEPGARLYKTGDLCRWLPDGVIEYLGRLDFQVKIRGNRIELGEIESVLSKHPGILHSVVTVRPDLPGGPGLAAYVVPQSSAAPTAEELRAFLRSRLPDFMVPAAFVSHESLPL
jgi:amino acid adenylation domain-containing protein